MRSFKAASSTLSPSWMSMARQALPSRLTLKRPERSFSEAPLGNVIFTVLVHLTRADESVVRPHGDPSPLPLFDDLRVGLVYDLAHFRERLPAPVSKFLDPL